MPSIGKQKLIVSYGVFEGKPQDLSLFLLFMVYNHPVVSAYRQARLLTGARREELPGFHPCTAGVAHFARCANG